MYKLLHNVQTSVQGCKSSIPKIFKKCTFVVNSERNKYFLRSIEMDLLGDIGGAGSV